jgi:hypothetical protein
MPPATMAEGNPCGKREIGAGVVTDNTGGGLLAGVPLPAAARAP